MRIKLKQNAIEPEPVNELNVLNLPEVLKRRSCRSVKIAVFSVLKQPYTATVAVWTIVHFTIKK
ncbi:hypothetical protein B0H13DRAFT_2308243 [Mycena leptocephala]|nr:hypothetical protein B0H13DRAFT_2308243 [Mycena leptocephala]